MIRFLQQLLTVWSLSLCTAILLETGLPSDPAYAQEHHQVFQAGLRAIVAISCLLPAKNTSIALGGVDAYVISLTELNFTTIEVFWCPEWTIPTTDIAYQHKAVKLITGDWPNLRDVEKRSIDVLVLLDDGGNHMMNPTTVGIEHTPKTNNHPTPKLTIYHSCTPLVVEKLFHRNSHTMDKNVADLHPALRYDIAVFSTTNETLAFRRAWSRFYHASDKRLALYLQPPSLKTWTMTMVKKNTFSTASSSTSLSKTERGELSTLVRHIERTVMDGVIGSTFRRFVLDKDVMQRVRRLPVYGTNMDSLMALVTNTSGYNPRKSMSMGKVADGSAGATLSLSSLPPAYSTKMFSSVFAHLFRGSNNITSSDNSERGASSVSSNSTSTPPSLMPKYAAVIVEPRLEATLEFCVRNVLHHLPPGSDWMMQVHHSSGPTGNERYVKRSLALSLSQQQSPPPPSPSRSSHSRDQPLLLLQAARIELVPLSGLAVTDGDSYNQLLRMASFWQQLLDRNIEKVLLFQTDSVMLKGSRKEDWQPFLRYDYIGSPWHMIPGAASGIWLRNKQRGGVLREGVGNGGFSLRSVEVMHYLTSEYATSNFAKHNNEDSFFAHYCEKMHAKELVKPYVRNNHHQKDKENKNHGSNGGGKGSSSFGRQWSCMLANRSVAAAFAVEVPCTDINHTVNWLKVTTMQLSNLGGGLTTATAAGTGIVSHNSTPLLSPHPPFSSIDTPMGLHTTWAYIDPQLTLLLLRKSISIDVV